MSDGSSVLLVLQGRKRSTWVTIRVLVCNKCNSWVKERELYSTVGLRISKDILSRGLTAQMTSHGKVCLHECVSESEKP